MSLAIKPISKAQGNKFNIPKFLPQPPFRMVFVAPTNSGKTTVINNMLSKPVFGYKAVFNYLLHHLNMTRHSIVSK